VAKLTGLAPLLSSLGEESLQARRGRSHFRQRGLPAR